MGTSEDGVFDKVGGIGGKSKFAGDLIDLVHGFVVVKFTAQIANLADLIIIEFAALLLKLF